MDKFFTLVKPGSGHSTHNMICMLENLPFDEVFESESFLRLLDRCKVEAPPHLVKALLGYIGADDVLPPLNGEKDDFILN